MEIMTLPEAGRFSPGPKAGKNKTIKDIRTGKLWIVGHDKDTNWAEANAWVRSIGDGWRMPSIWELKCLYQNGEGSRNIDPIFEMTGWWVWCGKVVKGYCARLFSFCTGSGTGHNIHDSYNARVFAVRS